MPGTRRGRAPGEDAGGAAPTQGDRARQREAAREAALRALEVRDRSTAELRARLRRKGYPPDVIEGVLERLTETGLLDDRRYAERFAAEAAGMRRMGGRRIRGELLAKGVDRDLAADAATVSPEEEEARARALAAQRAARMGSLDAATRYRRLAGLLARRGYPPDVVARVARDAAAAAGDGSDSLDLDEAAERA